MSDLQGGTFHLVLGGTANLAVLGGNLPPSFGTEIFRTNWCLPGARRAPVARSTSH